MIANIDLFSFIIMGIGYLIGELVSIINLQIRLHISINRKEILVRLHHAYFTIIAFITMLLNIITLTFLFIGIGIHDIILELRKKLKFLNKK